ncbi:MAG: hypothetical protein ACYS26_08040 [Planctomycetota bacterium]|jgi:hypothetical protein
MEDPQTQSPSPSRIPEFVPVFTLACAATGFYLLGLLASAVLSRTSPAPVNAGVVIQGLTYLGLLTGGLTFFGLRVWSKTVLSVSLLVTCGVLWIGGTLGALLTAWSMEFSGPKLYSAMIFSGVAFGLGCVLLVMEWRLSRWRESAWTSGEKNRVRIHPPSEPRGPSGSSSAIVYAAFLATLHGAFTLWSSTSSTELTPVSWRPDGALVIAGPLLLLRSTLARWVATSLLTWVLCLWLGFVAVAGGAAALGSNPAPLARSFGRSMELLLGWSEWNPMVLYLAYGLVLLALPLALLSTPYSRRQFGHGEVAPAESSARSSATPAADPSARP